MHCKPFAVALLTLLFTTNHVKGQFNALGSWNSLGVPDYLIMPNDEVTSDFLEHINLSLPEQSAVPEHSPQLLTDQVAELHIHDTTELFLTFTHEGAGWYNSLAFYTYTPDNVPTTAPAEDELTLIFPNTSYLGSGGGLTSGNKVSMGNFLPGQCIGFALVARGWKNYLEDVQNTTYIVYSNPEFNPESDSTLRQHCITMYDDATERVVLGFEDIHRQWGSCDHDFNDVLFYATASNPSALLEDDYSPISQELSTCWSTPEDLGVQDIKLYKTTCTWNPIEGAEAYRIRFRKWNSNDPWEYRNAFTDTSFTLGSIIPLKPATYYEWQIATTCNGVQTHNSELHVFQTLIPCEMPAGLSTLDITSTSATMAWTPVADIDHYILRFREVGQADWEWRNTGNTSFYEANDLNPNTTYEWSVNSFCSVVISCFSPYGTHKQFSTTSSLAPEQYCVDQTNYSTYSQPKHLHEVPINKANIKDINLDGIPEFIDFNADYTALHIQSVLDNDMGELHEIELDKSYSHFDLSDYNGDGLLDLVLTNLPSGNVLILQQNAHENFQFTQLELQLDEEISAWAGFAKMQEGAKKQFIFSNKLTDKISLMNTSNTENQRMLYVDEVAHYNLQHSTKAIALEDLNQDHHPDIIVQHEGPYLSLVLNRLSADTMPFISAIYELESPIEQLEIIDLNGDRKKDLVYTLKDTDGLWYQQNRGEENALFFDNPKELLPLIAGSIFISHKANDAERARIATAHSLESEITIWELLHHKDVIISTPVSVAASANIQQLWFQEINDDNLTDVLYSTGSDGLYLALSVENMATMTTPIQVSNDMEEFSMQAQKGLNYAWYLEENEGLIPINESDLNYTIFENELTVNSAGISSTTRFVCTVSKDICDERKCMNRFEITLESKSETSLKVYPNPAREFIHVEYNNPEKGDFSISIFQMDGAMKMTHSFSKEPGLFHVQLGIDDLNPGMYLLTITGKGDRSSSTFAVVR